MIQDLILKKLTHGFVITQFCSFAIFRYLRFSTLVETHVAGFNAKIYFPMKGLFLGAPFATNSSFFTDVRTLLILVKLQHHAKPWQRVSTVITSPSSRHALTNISTFKYKIFITVT